MSFTTFVGGEESLCRERKQAMALEYLPMVRTIVARVGRHLPTHVSGEDLLQEGLVGLMEALAKFDPEQGYEFGAFAMPRVRGAVLDALRRQDFVGRGVRRRARALSQVREVLAQRYGRQPVRAEIAREANISVTELTRRERELSQATVDSLEKPKFEDESGGGVMLRDSLVDLTGDASIQAEQVLRVKALAQAVPTLEERDRRLLRLYYEQGLSQREIASILSVSEVRVCQLHKRALARLSRMMDADPLVSQMVSFPLAS